MNFLQICQRLRREAAISGTGPASVTGQTGEMAQVVEWAQTAYEDILNLHDGWLFLRGDFSFQTIANTRAYTAAAMSISDLGIWRKSDFKIYLTASGASAEQRLVYLDWDDFRATYEYGAARTTTGYPTHITVKPDRSLALAYTPDDAYTVTGEYYKSPAAMAANADEPLFPERFHMIIVWRAMMLASAAKAAPEKYDHAKIEYRRLLSALRRDQLPAIVVRGAMA